MRYTVEVQSTNGVGGKDVLGTVFVTNCLAMAKQVAKGCESTLVIVYDNEYHEDDKEYFVKIYDEKVGKYLDFV